MVDFPVALCNSNYVMPYRYKVSHKGKIKFVEANFPHQALKKAFPEFKLEAGIRKSVAPLVFVHSGATEEDGWVKVEEQEERLF